MQFPHSAAVGDRIRAQQASPLMIGVERQAPIEVGLRLRVGLSRDESRGQGDQLLPGPAGTSLHTVEQSEGVVGPIEEFPLGEEFFVARTPPPPYCRKRAEA